MSAAAPEVTELAGFGVADFAALFSILCLLLLRFAWSATFGWIFDKLASLFDVSIPTGFFGSIHPLGAVADFFTGLNHAVYRALGVAIGQQEHVFHKMILWQAYVLTKTGDEIANLSYDTLQALGIVRHKVSAAALSAALGPLVKANVAAAVVSVPAIGVRPATTGEAVSPTTRVAVPANPAATKQAADTFKPLAGRVAKLEHEYAALHAQAIAVPIPIRVPGPGAVAKPQERVAAPPVPHAGEINHAIDWLTGKARSIGKVLTPAGILALGAAAVATFVGGWVKCSNVNKVGKNVCGMNPSLLESLLADALLIAGTVSLVEFAKGMEEIVAEVEGPIRTFWRAT